MERNNKLIFGYGRFKCLGQNVAWLELNKAFVEVFRRYDLQIVKPEKPWKSFAAGIYLQRDLFVRITRKWTVIELIL